MRDFTSAERVAIESRKPMTVGETAVMKQTFRDTMLRAAAIAEKITQDDVTEMQALLLAKGSTLEQVARIDRLTLAVAHLRACAEGTRG